VGVGGAEEAAKADFARGNPLEFSVSGAERMLNPVPFRTDPIDRRCDLTPDIAEKTSDFKD
jgi:hypothetical protein